MNLGRRPSPLSVALLMAVAMGGAGMSGGYSPRRRSLLEYEQTSADNQGIEFGDLDGVERGKQAELKRISRAEKKAANVAKSIANNPTLKGKA